MQVNRIARLFPESGPVSVAAGDEVNNEGFKEKFEQLNEELRRSTAKCRAINMWQLQPV
jgi:hypothetical protein